MAKMRETAPTKPLSKESLLLLQNFKQALAHGDATNAKTLLQNQDFPLGSLDSIFANSSSISPQLKPNFYCTFLNIADAMPELLKYIINLPISAITLSADAVKSIANLLIKSNTIKTLTLTNCGINADTRSH